MAEISVTNFIKELDSFFAKEDLQGAGRCLLEWRRRVVSLNDKKGELTVLNEMIGYYRQTRDEKEGLGAISAAFGLIDELKMAEKPAAGTIFLNGATTMKSFGKSAEAMEFYKKAMQNYRINLNENNPLFAGLYNNMALALQDLKRYSDAEKYFIEALNITEASAGNELETAVSRVNLAHLYYEINAEDCRINLMMEKALDILESEKYSDYPRYAFTCRKCAPSFGFFGYFIAERDLNERADKIYAGT